MTLARGLRRLALTAHITVSVGWIGAAAGFLALATTGLTTSDEQMTRAVYLAMEPTARLVIVPMAFASLLTGLVSSLTTPWGLLRHYWVVAKLAVTVLATIVLLFQLTTIGSVAAAARQATPATADLREARMSLAAHAGGGVLVLLLPAVLGVYKPPGLTRYGQRKHQQPRRASPP